MAGGIFSSLLSTDPIIQQTRVRLRRLMNEGFQGLLLSLFLFSAGVSLVSIYLHDRAALEEAITTEILNTVGTRQEPSDGARELGLIGAALSKLNSASTLAAVDCVNADPNCTPVDQLAKDVASEMSASIKSDVQGANGWSDVNFKINLAKEEGNTLTWRDLGEGSLCEKIDDNSFMILPAQMKSLTPPTYSDRIIRAAKLSKYFYTALRKFETHYPQVVQAYVISPDSLLNIWSRRTANACLEFNRSRLWAAKSYFAHFWDHPNDDLHSTLAYIDYGGNGLVRTTCHVLELTKTDNAYSRGELLGIVCTDAKLPENQVRLMRRQLFFETSLVTLPIAEEIRAEQVRADVSIPKSHGEEVSTSGPQATGTIKASTVPGAPMVESVAEIKKSSKLSRDQIEEERAVDMQPVTLDQSEIQNALHSELQNFTTRPWLREITRISFRGKTAFLLPLNIAGGNFNGLFFYPRTPRLPVYDSFFGWFGFILVGGAVASAGYNWRLRPKAVALTERLALFRNLQVGIVRVDPNDWIIECNDRAEELFGRKLPKPGVIGLPVNFDQLIETRLRHASGRGIGQNGSSAYKSLTTRELIVMRQSGEASAYYALLKTRVERTWVRVLATPVMLPAKNSSISSEVEMTEIFATITDVALETVAQLENHLTAMDGGAPV